MLFNVALINIFNDGIISKMNLNKIDIIYPDTKTQNLLFIYDLIIKCNCRKI